MFNEFNKEECIKNNVKTVVFFIVILFICVVSDIALFKVSQPYMQRLDNMFADLVAIVMFLFMTLLILIIYSFIVTLKIRVYKNILDNIKSFIGLIICNGIVAIFLSAITTAKLAFGYILIVSLVCSISFFIRYSSVKRH